MILKAKEDKYLRFDTEVLNFMLRQVQAKSEVDVDKVIDTIAIYVENVPLRAPQVGRVLASMAGYCLTESSQARAICQMAKTDEYQVCCCLLTLCREVGIFGNEKPL